MTDPKDYALDISNEVPSVFKSQTGRCNGSNLVTIARAFIPGAIVSAAAMIDAKQRND